MTGFCLYPLSTTALPPAPPSPHLKTKKVFPLTNSFPHLRKHWVNESQLKARTNRAASRVIYKLQYVSTHDPAGGSIVGKIIANKRYIMISCEMLNYNLVTHNVAT